MNKASKKKVLKVIKKNPKLFDDLKEKAVTKKTFKLYIKENFHIYQQYEKLAIKLRLEGRREHYSILAIMEKIRWDSNFSDNDSHFKINHNYSPWMSRLLMKVHPALKGMFRIASTNKRGEKCESAKNG